MKRNITDQLKHIRLIHFSLVTASALVAYLTLTPFLIGDKLRAELRDLQTLLPLLATPAPDPIEVNRAWCEDRRQDVYAIRFVRPAKLFPDWSYRVVGVTEVRTNGSISQILNDLSAYAVSVEMVDEPVDAAAFKEKRQAMRGDLDGGYTFGGSTTWQDQGQADVEISFDFKRARNGAGEPVVGEKIGGRFSTVSGTLRLEPSAETRFSMLANSVSSLGRKSLKEGAEHINSRFPLLESAQKNASLFGLEIEVAHIAIVGPIILLCIQCYLFAFLADLAAFSGRREIESAPAVWIGVMQAWTTRMLTALTMVVLPAACVYWPVHRLLVSRWALPLALVVLGLGLRCLGKAARIRRELWPTEATGLATSKPDPRGK